MAKNDDMQSYLTREELQGELLRILEAFDSYCSRHGLRFSLVGGTLLGAVRHQGFIPWDDDIDVGMPRPDFARLLGQADAFAEETGLRVEGFRTLKASESPMLKIVDPTIAALESGVYPTHLWIDVLPIDSLPEDEAASARQCKAASVYRKALAFLMTPRTEQSGRAVGLLKDRLVQPAVARMPALPRAVAWALRSTAAHVPFDSTEYAGIVAWGMYGERERIPASGLRELAPVSFEGRDFPGLSCTDLYLSSLYGDYMALPPEDKRVTHSLKAWRIEDETE